MDTIHVLVVDDEPGMRLGVKRSLRDFTVSLPDVHAEVQFETAMAETGEQALQMIHTAPPDILLLDHKLPGLSGLDVLEQIKPKSPKTLTVMITAYASVETAVTAIKQGAYDFLAKPFTPVELKATVRKAAESLMMARQARKLAREQRQVRFQFISVLAHELKAPLAAIEGYLKLVRERSIGDDQQKYDHMLDRSLLRLEGMRKMILDLLDLTRIESGQKKRDLAQLNLCDLARTALETFAPDAARRRITLAVHAPAPVPMTADKGEIEIIFNNLISNALKYNRDLGRVDVTVTAADNEVKISVADSGIGMTKEDCNLLFKDFVRIKNPQTRNVLGSGLGLSIVKKITCMYGGQVRVTSEPDVGSTFEVILPQNADFATTPADTSEPELPEPDEPLLTSPPAGDNLNV